MANVSHIFTHPAFRNREVDDTLAWPVQKVEDYVAEVSSLTDIWTNIVEAEARKLEVAAKRTVAASGEQL